MSSAHIMNVSQTNNSLLKNRLNQMSLELGTLKAKYTELEKSANHDKQAVDDYARAFTTNTTTNEKFILSNVLEENPLWETQTKTIRNIYLQVGSESKIVITLSDPFTYITNNDVHRVSELYIKLTAEEREYSINGISQFVSSSQIDPFNSPTIFAAKTRTFDDRTIYSVGETDVMPRIIFTATDAPIFKASITSATFAVKP